jgi:hypothetical protein
MGAHDDLVAQAADLEGALAAAVKAFNEAKAARDERQMAEASRAYNESHASSGGDTAAALKAFREAHAAHAQDDDLGVARRRLDVAQARLAEERRFWRQVGQLAPEDHDGFRPSHPDGRSAFGVRVVNDTAAPAEPEATQ